MQIINSIDISSIHFLDSRQKWVSLDVLKANTDKILMPNGFRVYCTLENRWYQLKATDESDTSTYVWSEISDIQVSELPDATSELEGKIYQYVGSTTNDYTNGFFYKCVAKGTSYVWTAVSVQSKEWVGTKAQWEALTDDEKKAIPDNTEVIITDDYTDAEQDIVTEWEETPSDIKVPSEKLTKSTFDTLEYGTGNVTKNLLDIEHCHVGEHTCYNSTTSTLTNIVEGSGRDYLVLFIRPSGYDSSEEVLVNKTFRETGDYSVTFILTEAKDVYFKHNDSDQDVDLFHISLNAGTYTFSFTLDGYNPTSIGGLIIKNLQIESGDIATSYEPYLNSVNVLKNYTDDNFKIRGWTLPDKFKGMNYIDDSRQFHINVDRIFFGDIEWTYDSTTARIYSETISGYIKPPATTSEVANVYCTSYEADSGSNTSTHVNDKRVSIGIDGKIWVYDSAYTDADTFKTAMASTCLYYQRDYEWSHNVDGSESGGSYHCFRLSTGDRWINGRTIIKQVWQVYSKGTLCSGFVDAGNNWIEGFTEMKKSSFIVNARLLNALYDTDNYKVEIYDSNTNSAGNQSFIPCTNNMGRFYINISNPYDVYVIVEYVA